MKECMKSGSVSGMNDGFKKKLLEAWTSEFHDDETNI